MHGKYRKIALIRMPYASSIETLNSDMSSAATTAILSSSLSQKVEAKFDNLLRALDGVFG